MLEMKSCATDTETLRRTGQSSKMGFAVFFKWNLAKIKKNSRFSTFVLKKIVPLQLEIKISL